MVDIEEYSFKHIMTIEEWKRLNSGIIENACISRKNMSFVDFLKGEIENEKSNFYEERKSNGQNEQEVYKDLSREDKRIYRVYEFLYDKCIFDDVFSSEENNLGSSSYKMLDAWEVQNNKYSQSHLMHFYYLATCLETIAAIYEKYRVYKKKTNEWNKVHKKQRPIKPFYSYYIEYIQ